VSFLDVGDAEVSVLALKHEEDGSNIVVRLVENMGREQSGVHVRFAGQILHGSELDGLEAKVGDALIEDNALVVDFRPFQIRTFSVALAPPNKCASEIQSRAAGIPYNSDVVAAPGETDGGAFDTDGHAYSADQFPETLLLNGVRYRFGPSTSTSNNAVLCRGQSIPLPEGDFDTVHILAASNDGDGRPVFRIGSQKHAVVVQDYGEDVIMAASRLGSDGVAGGEPVATPAIAKSGTIAWVGSHRVDSQGCRVPYTYCYLFEYVLPYDRESPRLILPNRGNVAVFAVSVAENATASFRRAEVAEWEEKTLPARDAAGIQGRMAAFCALVVGSILLCVQSVRRRRVLR